MCRCMRGGQPCLTRKYIQLVSEAGFPKERLKIYNDCEVLLHTQEDENMIAVVSGTGSIMMGRRPDGEEARFGGRGHLLGDEGSAFYLVKEAVIRLIHYMDGYGDCEYMLRRFSEASGMRDPIEIARYYQRYCVSEKNNISQYAPVVSESAEHGDPGALEVMESAAQGLYMGVIAVANALGFTEKDPIHVVYWGSILEKVPLISSRLTELIHAAYPRAVTALPDNSAVGIALDIAMQN